MTELTIDDVIQDFIKDTYKKTQINGWSFYDLSLNINKTFHKICEEKYNGDIDLTLDNFFRNKIIEGGWFQMWIIENEYYDFYDLINNDTYLKNYMNRITNEELKILLDIVEIYCK